MLLLCFVLPEYLVWIQISIGVCIRMVNSDTKESPPLPLPESPRYYIQPLIIIILIIIIINIIIIIIIIVVVIIIITIIELFL